eukprot:TRINITY_DN924_c0_g1_i8.p1 TRINITY_DN924_c0_g1~~TRINITY_DN924_c0_g1_i8.p1  ORF type:complete len:189 (+),score=43.73 TRINITY_DN924_c0_g1_i8:120-686(+)
MRRQFACRACRVTSAVPSAPACQEDSDCGTGSCQKIMGTGLCTYAAADLIKAVSTKVEALPPVAVGTNPTHYGDPKTGCETDEEAVRVQGLQGDFCSPKCTSGGCPTDVPAGDKATPTCALRTTTGDKYCALVCQEDSDCGYWFLPEDHGHRPAGSCQKIMGAGICSYTASAFAKVSALFGEVRELVV